MSHLARLPQLFVGPLAPYGAALTSDPRPDDLPVAILLTGESLTRAVTQAAQAYPEGSDTRAIASLWSKTYLRGLIPAPMIAAVGGVPLDLAPETCAVRADFSALVVRETVPLPDALAGFYAHLDALATGLKAATGIAIDAHFAPSSELGGDFWGIDRLPGGRVAVYMVDFSGHGVGAALNTFRLDAICRQVGSAGLTPAEFLAAMNRRLCGLLPSGQFATMLTGLIDPVAGVFHYASAGSTTPMMWLPGDEAPRLGDGSGLPLGLLSSATYDSRQLPMPPGARLFFYSDAAIEIPLGGDGHEVLDEWGLATLLSRRLHEPDGARLLGGLLDDLHATGPIDDDLTALLLTRQG